MFKSEESSSGLTTSSEYFDQLRIAKNKSEKVTLEDAKPKLDEVLYFLKNCDDYTSKEIGDALNDLVTMPEDMSVKLTQEDLSKNRGDVGEYLTQNGYAELFVKIVLSLKSHLRVYAKLKVSQALENFKLVLRGFCNYTAWCPQLQIDFAHQDGVKTLFPLLEYIDINLPQCDPISKPLIQQILLFLISIFLNCIKYCPKNRSAYREANAFQILSNMKSSDKNVQLLALLTMAYVVDDKQSQSLSKSHDCVKLLTEMLDECVKSPDHSVIIDPLCYSIREILDGLNHLTINDDNKLELQKHRGLSIISQMMEDDSFTEDEKRLAVEAIGALVYVKSIRETNEVKEAAPMLEKLASSSNAPLRQASKCALFEINEETIKPIKDDVTTVVSESPPTYMQAVAEGAKGNMAGHVMISYQWNSQERAIYIRDKLREHGYNVWLDLDEMKGNILDAMANAVEDSTVVLMCMSEAYKDSYNCRSEATYAYKLKRPIIPLLMEEGYAPDGWLGLILGTRLYYKFCCDRETNVDGLLKEIQKLQIGNK
ncbi:uncharacterized protein [Amphiura filiformis]